MHDVEAAHAAGMCCVAVSYGYHHRPPAELHADRVIDRFDDLLSLVIDSSPDSPIERRSEPIPPASRPESRP
jgi:phosphoglycolate phosphatase